MDRIVDFLNMNSGALSVVINLLLVIITGIYVILTGNLARTSNKTIEHTFNEYKEKKLRDKAVRSNLIYILYSEIFLNSFIYVLSQYYLLNGDQINLSERLKHFLNSGASVNATSKSHIISHTKLGTWKEVNAQCAKYLSNPLMKELTGYYAGVENSKIFSVNGMSNEKFIEFCRLQLISSYKCFKLLKDEQPNLKVEEEYHIGDKVVTVDWTTGKLAERS